MALSTKEEKRVSSKVFSCLNLTVGLVLVVIGIACWRMGSSAITEVNQGLVDEGIYFPPAGNPAFSEKVFPAAQKYAGKQVVDGPLAKAYAEDFLGVQVDLVSQGKTSSEISGALAMDPTNAALQQQFSTLFQLGTTKILLLSSGYGAWAQSKMIKNVGLVALVAGVVLLGASGVQMMRYKRLQ